MLPHIYYFKVKKINCVKRLRQVVEWDPKAILYINATNDEEWTRQQVEEYSNRVANYFLQKGLKKGDTVAFFMPNRPEYIITWFGLSKIGVIPALVNYNLRKKPLLHTIKVVKCRAVIYGLELESGTVSQNRRPCILMHLVCVFFSQPLRRFGMNSWNTRAISDFSTPRGVPNWQNQQSPH